MGRVPTRNLNLPAGMRARHRGDKTYYYMDSGEKPRRETPLGQDYVTAVQKWAELTSSKVPRAGLPTFRYVAERYMRDVLPGKGDATQALNLRELASLYKFFDERSVALDEIEPVNIRQYLDWRTKWTVAEKLKKNKSRTAAGKPPLAITGKEGQVPANREKALFSHIWNYARDKGLTAKANPCRGIKGFKEDGRDVYIDDDLYDLVYEYAEPLLRDALELAYLLGQRPADTLKLARADIKNGALSVRQNKTKQPVRVAIEGRLAGVLTRIAARKVAGLKLLNLTQYELRGAFDRARDAAVLARPDLEHEIRQYQFRDLRAKAGTDTEEARGMDAAQAQLGHSTSAMTAHYVRHRLGKLVKPTK